MRLHVTLVAATVAALSATLPLSRLSGNYLEPPHFALFQKLTYVQQGLVGGILLSGLGWLCLRLSLRPWLSFALHTAYFAYFGWLSAWALTRKLFGLDLSPLYLYGFLTEPGTLAGVGFRPAAFFSVLAVAVALVAGLGALGAASLVNGRRRVVARRRAGAARRARARERPGARLPRAGDRPGAVRGAGLRRRDALSPAQRAARPRVATAEARAAEPRGAGPGRAVRRRPSRHGDPAHPASAGHRLAVRRVPARGRDLPDATPYLWSQRERFEIRLDREHWSGGNSTPYALFSMLSGLGAWQLRTFQDERLTFPFLDLLRANGYRLRTGKSVAFDYHGIRQLLPPDTILPVIERRPLDAADLEMLDRYFADRETRPAGAVLRLPVLRRDPLALLLPRARTPSFDRSRRPIAASTSIAARDEIARIRNRYANACHFVDRQVRRVIEDLDRARRLRGHRRRPRRRPRRGARRARTDDALGRTERGAGPLAAVDPRAGPAGARRLARQPTSHVDIVATLLDALGFDADVLYTQGRSLLERQGERTTLVLAEQGYLEPSYHVFVTPRTISRWRYVGGRFLFASVQPRDGGCRPAVRGGRRTPPGSPSSGARRRVRPRSIRCCRTCPKPPRRFSRPMSTTAARLRPSAAPPLANQSRRSRMPGYRDGRYGGASPHAWTSTAGGQDAGPRSARDDTGIVASRAEARDQVGAVGQPHLVARAHVARWPGEEPEVVGIGPEQVERAAAVVDRLTRRRPGEHESEELELSAVVLFERASISRRPGEHTATSTMDAATGERRSRRSA